MVLGIIHGLYEKPFKNRSILYGIEAQVNSIQTECFFVLRVVIITYVTYKRSNYLKQDSHKEGP